MENGQPTTYLVRRDHLLSIIVERIVIQIHERLPRIFQRLLHPPLDAVQDELVVLDRQVRYAQPVKRAAKVVLDLFERLVVLRRHLSIALQERQALLLSVPDECRTKRGPGKRHETYLSRGLVPIVRLPVLRARKERLRDKKAQKGVVRVDLVCPDQVDRLISCGRVFQQV